MISYSGDGTDPDDGTLPASAFTWNIDFLHEGHVHPGTPISGVKSGTFTIPTSGHDFSGNTRYRITLTVTDSTGLTDTRSVLIYPRKVNLSFNTAPAGLTVYLDGIAKTTPFVYDTLSGFSHTVEARNQASGGTSYTFGSWSDGGAQTHAIVVPAVDQSYVATFQASAAPPTIAAYSFNEGLGDERGGFVREWEQRRDRERELDHDGQVRECVVVQRFECASDGRRRPLARLDDGNDAGSVGFSDRRQRLAGCCLQGPRRHLLPGHLAGAGPRSAAPSPLRFTLTRRCP